MSVDKIVSLVGFAIRARKAVFGVDGIAASGRRVYVILYDGALSAGSLARLQTAAARTHATLVRSVIGIADITHKTNCKAVGITDKQMAAAVVANLNNNFIEEPVSDIDG